MPIGTSCKKEDVLAMDNEEELGQENVINGGTVWAEAQG